MFCAECGNQLSDTARFCTKCGAAVGSSPPPVSAAPPPPPPPPPPTRLRAPIEPEPEPDDEAYDEAEAEPVAAENEAEAEQVVLAWENRIRVLLNPVVWRGMFWAFGISCALGGVLFLVISQDITGLMLGGVAFGGLMVIFIIVGGIIDLFGGFHVRFALTTAGVRSMSGKGAKAAAGTAFWVGVLAGNPGLAGSGMLARSEQNMFIPFGDVTALKLSPGRAYIEVKGGFLQKPIGLYCLAENYSRVESILRKNCQTAKIVG